MRGRPATLNLAFVELERRATLEDKSLWVVGRTINNSIDRWEFQGVYDRKDLAIAACRDNTYFIGSASMNETLPDGCHEWPGAYYPKPDIERAIKEPD